MENLLKNNEIEAAIEGILFTAGEPVLIDKLSDVLEISFDEVMKHIENLREQYKMAERGIGIVVLGDKAQMCSNSKYSEFIRAVLNKKRSPSLSKAALEILAVVAYRQPVTRVYVEHIRGVECSNTLAMLEERGLICEAGRLEVPGRPILYKTTDAFLRLFGISDIKELPIIDEMKDSDGEVPIQDGD